MNSYEYLRRARAFAETRRIWNVHQTAALLVPLGSYLQGTTGSWSTVFLLAIAFDWVAALLALFVLKPLRRRMLSA